MFKYRKKPIIIEAFEYQQDMGTETAAFPRWIIDACVAGIMFNREGNDYIKTLEGEMLCSDGDMIIRGVKGELYPCKRDIFDLTYEAVND